MRKVFIVTRGSDSDYTIAAVFGSKVLAERYIAGGGGDDFEEYVVDAEDGKVMRVSFITRIDHRTGTIEESWPQHLMARRSERSAPALVNTALGYSIVYSFVSAAHSRKLAAEERQRLLREGYSERGRGKIDPVQQN